MMKKLYIIIFMLLFNPFSLNAKEEIRFQDAIFEIQNEILISQNTLNLNKEKIDKEKKTLLINLEKINKEISDLEIEKRKISSSLKNTETTLSKLKENIAYYEKPLQIILNELLSYSQDNINQTNYTSLITQEAIYKKIYEIISTKQKEFQNLYILLKGNSLSQKAIGMDKTVYDGVKYLFGNKYFFISDDKKICGWLTQNNKTYPDLEMKISNKIIPNLLGSKIVTIPMKLKTEYINESFFQITISQIKKGGIIMLPIIFLGFLTIFISLYKTFTIFKIPKNFNTKMNNIIKFIKNNEKNNAIIEAKTITIPLHQIIHEGILHVSAEKELLEEIMHEQIIFQMPYFEKGMSYLSLSAATAPLFGLLGTVSGMMETFTIISIQGTGKVDLMSKGISEALLTTKYGLIVAIASLIAHNIFNRKIKKTISTLEKITADFIKKTRNDKNI